MPAEKTEEQKTQEEPSLEAMVVEAIKAATGIALAQQFSTDLQIGTQQIQEEFLEREQ